MKSVLLSLKVFCTTLFVFMLMAAFAQAAIEGGDAKRGKELANTKMQALSHHRS